MWEEGVKSPATAMGAASFRHGAGNCAEGYALWDLDRWARCANRIWRWRAICGNWGRGDVDWQRLPSDAGDLFFSFRRFERVAIFDRYYSAQLVAERLARLSGSDRIHFGFVRLWLRMSGLLPGRGRRDSEPYGRLRGLDALKRALQLGR